MLARRCLWQQARRGFGSRRLSTFRPYEPSRWPIYVSCVAFGGFLVYSTGYIALDGHGDLADLVRRARTGAFGSRSQLDSLLTLVDVMDATFGLGVGVPTGPILVKMGVLRCVASALHSEDPEVRTVGMNLLGLLALDSDEVAWLAAQNPRIWQGILNELLDQVPLAEKTWPRTREEAESAHEGDDVPAVVTLEPQLLEPSLMALGALLRAANRNVVEEKGPLLGSKPGIEMAGIIEDSPLSLNDATWSKSPYDGLAPIEGDIAAKEQVEGVVEGSERVHEASQTYPEEPYYYDFDITPGVESAKALLDAASSKTILRVLSSLIYHIHYECRPVDVDGVPKYNTEKSVYESTGIHAGILTVLAATEFHTSEVLAAVACNPLPLGQSSIAGKDGRVDMQPDWDEVLAAAWALTPAKESMTDIYINGSVAFYKFLEKEPKDEKLASSLKEHCSCQDKGGGIPVLFGLWYCRDPDFWRNQVQAQTSLWAGLAWGAVRRAIRFVQRGERYGVAGNPRMALIRAAWDVASTTALGSWFLTTVFSDSGLNSILRRRWFVPEKRKAIAYTLAHGALAFGVLWWTVQVAPYSFLPWVLTELIFSSMAGMII